MDRSRRNVLLLALCQAVFITTASLMATIGTLAGHVLAADKALATLPATALTVGTALGTIPASLIMRRVGRRVGFIVGSGFTMAGGLVGAWALVIQSFWLLSAGGFLMGVSSACSCRGSSRARLSSASASAARSRSASRSTSRAWSWASRG